jgi:TolB protein
MKNFLLFAASMVATLASSADAPAQPAAATAPSSSTPDESVLGTVEVNGSAGSMVPLPKLAIVPLVSSGAADSLVMLVVRRDMELSGQFELIDDANAPPGPFTRDGAIDLVAWKQKGAEYVVRVYAQATPNDSVKTDLVAEAFVTPTKAEMAALQAKRADAGVEDASVDALAPKPAFKTAITTATTEMRAASHRLVDQLLGALTGRPGGFASHMTYAGRVGRWRRVFALDADGFDLHALGPTSATVLSPTFGPGGQIFYALSSDYSPYRLAWGPDATPVPLRVPGSILGVAFSTDRTRLALTVMDEGKSTLWLGANGVLQPVPSAPFANHPAFGPLGKVAYVGGSPVQRVYVDGKPVSPPGFMASAPAFCDTPQGLLVILTVGVGAGADLIATDSNGGGVRRLTQNQGSNTYAACSPDGRLIAYFSTSKAGKGPGLYVMPVQRPWLAKKISNEVGESLRWER